MEIVTTDFHSQNSLHTFQDESKYPELIPANDERTNIVTYINNVNEKIENMLTRKRTLLKARYLDMLNGLEKLQSQALKYQSKIKFLRESIDKDSEILKIKGNIESLQQFLQKIKTNFFDLETQTKTKVDFCKSKIAAIKGKKDILKKVYHDNLLTDLGIKRLYEAGTILSIPLPVSEQHKGINLTNDSSIHFLNASQSASLLQNSLHATRPTQEDDDQNITINDSQILPRLVAKATFDDMTLIIDQQEASSINIPKQLKKLKQENNRLRSKTVKLLADKNEIRNIFDSGLDYCMKQQILAESKISKDGLNGSMLFSYMKEELVKEGRLGSMKDLERRTKFSKNNTTQGLEAKEIIFKQLTRAKKHFDQNPFSLPKLSLTKERFETLNFNQFCGLLCVDNESVRILESLFYDINLKRKMYGKTLNDMKSIVKL